MSKLVKLQLSSTALAQFPDLPTELARPKRKPKPKVKHEDDAGESPVRIEGTDENDKKRRIIIKPLKKPGVPSSPVVEDTPSRAETPTGSKARASGLSGELDRSGRPCKRWTNKTRVFKTFSGWDIEVGIWRPST
ncbi:hypothetical protein KL930_000869 [Ogataea haglerorum]|uniref:Uncharacterized protein n=1 Tax=Ogataea haglerorum TaxID=1937702 RepID=A0AAN6D9M7_9ASCO|nr:uncharacterized protein KL911_003552 [Ogataea haglerorum]KAG7700181.1 hypothetical protein KL915_000870 [Ogataea haglerorum]KAG7701839.1 hypothetical protein KL951_000295 [Ogataea haglerorum]KAG7711652.1 hypothetical protein KL914_000294 [Ogataea haglerorum]KAG7712424.1 hypothetical protein KL950_000295 [Ogataea haglerorum]KAG7722476.1 hypothetical protein KL913_000296 [Ogataea haglerorum]